MDDYKIPIKFFTNATISHINHEIGNLKGNRVNFAGQIVSAEHLTTQNGKAYARLK